VPKICLFTITKQISDQVRWLESFLMALVVDFGGWRAFNGIPEDTALSTLTGWEKEGDPARRLRKLGPGTGLSILRS